MHRCSFSVSAEEFKTVLLSEIQLDSFVYVVYTDSASAADGVFLGRKDVFKLFFGHSLTVVGNSEYDGVFRFKGTYFNQTVGCFAFHSVKNGVFD